MTDAELRAHLRSAFFPFVKGFLWEPSRANITFTITESRISAAVGMGQQDFDEFDQDTTLRTEVRRAYNNLVRYSGDERGPSLSYVNRDDTDPSPI